jgi:hypothetical protein
LVVRVGGQWRILPVDLEDEEADAPGQEWVALTLNPTQLQSWNTQDILPLRRALPKTEWAFRNEGLGVFLTGAIALDGSR